MTKSDLVDLELILVAQTEKAILVKDEPDAKGVWLAKIHADRDQGGGGWSSAPMVKLHYARLVLADILQRATP